ncbi:MAG: hypothetical protein K5837_03190 [Candidatus Saccharibacteria bacterium]|nr:hypothetical protein [Candidatus Saccharibacteria bacterium]
MSQFEKMTIPGMADGIVDDQEQFEEQQRKNEAQLEAEIKDSKNDSSLDSLIGGYDDRVKFVPFKEVKMSPEQLAKLAKRRQVIGHALLSKLAS